MKDLVVPSQEEHWCSFDQQFKLRIHRDPTREELDNEILFLWRVRDACRMAIARLICLGEDLFGQKYAPAQLATGRAYDTLAGWVRVYRAVPENIWRDELPFSYHKAVAYREPPTEIKDEYLGRAVVGEFEDAADLNQTLREEQGLIEPPLLISVRCPKCGERLTDRYCNKHCTHCGAKPVEWAEAYWTLKSTVVFGTSVNGHRDKEDR